MKYHKIEYLCVVASMPMPCGVTSVSLRHCHGNGHADARPSCERCNQNLKTMASNIDLVNYIADQCGGAGEIVTRLMFGDYAIYCDGKIFGLISDNGFYLKPTQAGKALLREVIIRPPYEGAKDYFFVPDVDDRDYLSALVRATCDELPAPKPKRRKTVK